MHFGKFEKEKECPRKHMFYYELQLTAKDNIVNI